MELTSLFQGARSELLTLEQLRQYRIVVEARLEEVLNHPPPKGWAADSQNLANRFRKHWTDWFTQFWILDFRLEEFNPKSKIQNLKLALPLGRATRGHDVQLLGNHATSRQECC